MALISRKKVLGFPKRQNILKNIRERYEYSKHYRGISNYAVESLSYDNPFDIGVGLKDYVDSHNTRNPVEFLLASKSIPRLKR